ncbi:MAG: helix-turn-helix domain-containing protein [Acidimicrobiales bacterium]
MADRPTSRRARQAEQTHADILRAARRLFAERGYARTSVRDVAEAAGVSAQTVYYSVGSKRALVTQLNDLIDEEAGIPSLAMAAARATDPVEVAATPARITRAILERCGDIVRAAATGAAAEPELAAMLAQGHDRHVAGARQVVGMLEGMGALRPGVTAAEAVDTAAALADVRVALVLRDDYGWSFDRIERWTADTTRALILA